MLISISRAWSTPKLDIGVRWLLRRCGAPHTECRHMCMKLVHQLCPLVEGKLDHYIELSRIQVLCIIILL